MASIVDVGGKPKRSGFAQYKTIAASILALAVVTIAAVALFRFSTRLDLAGVLAALRALPVWRVASSILLTAGSHLLLTCYDTLALRSVGMRLPWRTTARAAFTSYTLSHNLGFGAITGGSARLRIYGSAGLSQATIGRIVIITGTAFWSGVIAVATLSLLFVRQPIEIADRRIEPASAQLAGFVALLVFLIAGLLARRLKAGQTMIGHLVPAARLSDALILLVIAALDLAFAALALLVLLPGSGLADFPQFYIVYALAIIAGLLAHVPGGIGIFETIVLTAFPLKGSQMAAALLAYRAIYYFLPLGISLAMNAVIELGGLRRFVRPTGKALGWVSAEITPLFFGALTFGAGLILLLSGVLPAIEGRLRILDGLLPLPVIEVSHLAASLAGTALLLIAPSLVARLNSAMHVARNLLLFGALFSLGKGLDFEEATVMLAIAGLLQLSAPAFYRATQGAFSTHNRAWLLAATGAVAVSVLSGYFAYREFPFDGELWWQFALHSDAPRFLRASFATGVLVAAFALRELISRPYAHGGTQLLPDIVYRRATAQSRRSDAALAFTGDKRFLVSKDGGAFIMFHPFGRTWLVMGDPVGPREHWHELVWEIRRLSDHSYARLCFYQISEAMLAIAVELGLTAIKYGEEAHIDIPAFKLTGPAMKSLRNSHTRAKRDGLRLKMIAAPSVIGWLDRLKPVSDAWLSARGGAEKSFSLGCFDAAYLTRFDLAVVLQDEQPVAFANIWKSGDGEEMSVDLMRHAPDASPGTMDFLLAELIMQARNSGYERFNLGLAPLSGVRGGALAPFWARIASLVFTVGAPRYNFTGLRRYKEKFSPKWESRFIAVPTGIAGLRALIELNRLISGRSC